MYVFLHHRPKSKNMYALFPERTDRERTANAICCIYSWFLHTKSIEGKTRHCCIIKLALNSSTLEDNWGPVPTDLFNSVFHTIYIPHFAWSLRLENRLVSRGARSPLRCKRSYTPLCIVVKKALSFVPVIETHECWKGAERKHFLMRLVLHVHKVNVVYFFSLCWKYNVQRTSI